MNNDFKIQLEKGQCGMPSSAASASGRPPVNAAAAAAAMSSDISRRNPQEDYELLQVQHQQDLKYFTARRPFKATACMMSFFWSET